MLNIDMEEINFTTPEISTNSTAIAYNFWPVSNVDLWQYIINFMLAFPTHFYIIWLIVTGRRTGVASEFFNINLSVCEICFSVYCLLCALSKFIQIQSSTVLTAFFIGVTITGRPLFQCLICVERYLAVVQPVTFLKYKPLRYRLICCTVVWIITLGSGLGCMFTSVLYNFKGYMWIFSTEFLLFLSIQLFCCLAVLRALKQSKPGEKGREKDEENHMKRKAFHLILINTLSMVIIFVPNIFTGFFTIFRQLHTDPLISFAFACFILGGFVHPVLFLQRTGKLSCVCSS